MLGFLPDGAKLVDDFSPLQLQLVRNNVFIESVYNNPLKKVYKKVSLKLKKRKTA